MKRIGENYEFTQSVQSFKIVAVDKESGEILTINAELPNLTSASRKIKVETCLRSKEKYCKELEGKEIVYFKAVGEPVKKHGIIPAEKLERMIEWTVNE